MRPAARWQAAIEILAEIAAQPRAADAILGDWGRAHRYAGAKDRAAISDLVFLVLRRRAELAHVAGTDAPRALVLAALARLEGAAPEALSTAIAEGGKYAMAPLSAAESALAARAAAMSDAELPTAARANVPDWLMPDLAAAFGGRLEAEAAALTGRAPLDLRANTLKAARTQARERLAGEAVETELCPLSPVGLRVTGRRQVTGTAAFREGLVEVQDEGSQLAALLTGARPGETVVDLCAGAGGKTLALAATMEDRGRLVAFDSDPARLGRLAPRAARAGVTIVEARAADPLAVEADPLLRSLAGEADRVLLDAPCSGSGTWRRRPEEKWRLDPDRLSALNAVQGRLIAAAAGLVRPGGHLIYVTCSVLPRENRAIVDGLLAAGAAFRQVPVAEVWRDVLGAEPPDGGNPDLLLTPARTGTDGFYVAVLQRTA